MAGEMRLIGKAGFERSTCKTFSPGNHLPGALQPAHQEVAMRTCAENFAELPRQREAIEPADGLEFLGTHGPLEIGAKVFGCLQNCVLVGLSRLDVLGAGMPVEALRDPNEDVVKRQFVDAIVEVHHGFSDRLPQGLVTHHRCCDEGQGAPRFAERGEQAFRLQIHHPIAQPDLRSRAAIVDLVRVEDDDASGPAETAFTAVLERLDAAERHADRIGVVAVQFEKFPMQARFYALDAIDGGSDPDTLTSRPAQSFKIDGSTLR